MLKIPVQIPNKDIFIAYSIDTTNIVEDIAKHHINSCNGSKHRSAYTSNTIVRNGTMKNSINLKKKNEPKHTTTLLSMNNIDNIKDNSNGPKIKLKNSSTYTSNSHTVAHEIMQLHQRQSSHIFHLTFKNKLNTDITKHELEHLNEPNESIYASITIASDAQDKDIMEHTLKSNTTSHITKNSQSNFQGPQPQPRLTTTSTYSLPPYHHQQQRSPDSMKRAFYSSSNNHYIYSNRKNASASNNNSSFTTLYQR